jgi:hypothetical protein
MCEAQQVRNTPEEEKKRNVARNYIQNFKQI